MAGLDSEGHHESAPKGSGGKRQGLGNRALQKEMDVVRTRRAEAMQRIDVAGDLLARFFMAGDSARNGVATPSPAFTETMDEIRRLATSFLRRGRFTKLGG